MSAEDTDNPDDLNPLELQALECLAFSLLVADRPDVSLEVVRDEWQSTADIRTRWRETAKGVSARLLESGTRLRVGEKRALHRQLEWLMTVPPRAAYSVDEEHRALASGAGTC